MFSIVNIVIALVILSFGLVGWKRGVFKQLILFLGVILVVVLAYSLKNIIGDFFLLQLPFFDFPNFLNGACVLNIILYQSLAFLIAFVILMIVYKIILAVTGILEKLLRITVILGFASKILGFIVGLIEGYIFAFVVLFFLAQPALNLDFISNSSFSNFILNKSPILSSTMNDTLDITTKIYNLHDLSSDEFNLQALDIILDKKVTSVEIIEQLIEDKKLIIKNVDTVLDKYR